MVMVQAKPGDREYYMDGYLHDNLTYVKDRVLNYKNMMVCIIDGRPGTGKSTLAAQISYFCSNGHLTLTNEIFTVNQFLEEMKNAKKGDGLILDEAFDLLNKRKAQSNQNMIALSILQQMRVRQSFIFIVLPSVFDLDKNIILNLCDTFIHTYRKPFGARGQFSVYDIDGLKKLWLYGRQSLSYSPKIAKPNFRGRFTKFFPLDMEAYEDKKNKALESMKLSEKPEGSKYLTQRNKLIVKMREEGKPVSKISDLISLKQRTVYDILKQTEV